MKQNIRLKLEKKGYRVMDTQEFLGLTDEEMAVINLKITLIEKVKKMREDKGITQEQLARLIHSSQPRVAMLERGRPEASLDLICRALFALGISQRELGNLIGSSASRAA